MKLRSYTTAVVLDAARGILAASARSPLALHATASLA